MCLQHMKHANHKNRNVQERCRWILALLNERQRENVHKSPRGMSPDAHYPKRTPQAQERLR